MKSQKLSYLLRHDPSAANLTMDAQGWVDVNELVTNTGVTESELLLIVETNDKKRFEFDVTGTKIRACQGHSVAVDLQLERQIPPSVLYHGTSRKAWDIIKIEGIKPMTRTHVQLSDDVQTARTVGLRHDRAPLIITVHSGAMSDDGLTFYRSTNGVWLAKFVPAKYCEVK